MSPNIHVTPAPCDWTCTIAPYLAPISFAICFVAVGIAALWALEQTRNDRY